MISSEWIRDIVLGVCFGMVGFQSSLVLMMPPLGLLMLLIVLATLLNLRLAVTLLVFFVGWGPPVGLDAVEAASLLPASPNVWTDGSLVLDRVTGVSSSGAGLFAHQPASCWDHRCWGHVDPVRPVGDFQCCRFFFAVPGPLQSVQRAEMWGVILALQSSGAVHLGADEAADFGRRRVGNAVIDASRNLSGVCGRWYPVILDLHRFFIAISRAVVNHDGRDGTAPDPLVWSAGALPKRRGLVHAVRDRAFLPGPPGIWVWEWVHVPASAFCAEDIARRPYTPGLLVKWVSFLG